MLEVQRCGTFRLKIQNIKFITEKRKIWNKIENNSNIKEHTNMDGKLRTNIEESSKAAGDFTKVYYDSLDNKRHQMSRLYLDNAIAVWNGNEVTGKDNIQNFFVGLPDIEHSVQAYDAQPVIDETIANQQTLLLIVSGTIRIKKAATKPFQQTFMITAEGDKWKIVRDCFRIQDALSTLNKK